MFLQFLGAAIPKEKDCDGDRKESYPDHKGVSPSCSRNKKVTFTGPQTESLKDRGKTVRKVGAEDGDRDHVEHGIPYVGKSVDDHLVHVVDVAFVTRQGGQIGCAVVIISDSNRKVADVVDDKR